MVDEQKRKFSPQEQIKEEFTLRKVGNFIKKYQNFIVIVISLIVLAIAIYFYAKRSERIQREKLHTELGMADTAEKLEPLIERLPDDLKPFYKLKLERLYREASENEYSREGLKKSIALLKEIISESTDTIVVKYASARIRTAEDSLKWLEEREIEELKKLSSKEERKPKLPIVLDHRNVDFAETKPEYLFDPLTGSNKIFGPTPQDNFKK